jgi:hypothetical protein
MPLLRHPVAFIACSSLLAACATAQPPRVEYRPRMSPAEEAAAIEAAKQSPIAHPEARSQYPEKSPPPLYVETERPGSAAPPDAMSANEIPPPPPTENAEDASSGGDAADDSSIAPAAPPNDYVDSPSYAAPSADYVWAPGYWSWSGARYVWIGGDWLAPRPGYVYVAPSWRHSELGWQSSVGGWARPGGGVAYPVYRHPYHSYQPYYWSPESRERFAPSAEPRRYGSSGYYESPRYRAPTYQERGRRESAPNGYVQSRQYEAPPARYQPTRGAPTQPEPARLAAPAATSNAEHHTQSQPPSAGRSQRSTNRPRH